MGQVKLENLRRLTDEELVFDKPLPFDVFDEAGVLYRPQGKVLRKSDFQRSKRRLRGGLFLDGDARAKEAALEYETIKHLRSLTIGQALPCDIYDQNGLLLQPRGAQITERLRQLIRYRPFKPGSMEVPVAPEQADEHKRSSKEIVPGKLAPPEPSTLPAEATMASTVRELDHALLSMDLTNAVPGPPPTEEPRLPLQLLREQTEAGGELYDKSVEIYADIATSARNGKSISLTASNDMLSNMIKLQGQDPSVSMLLMDLAATLDGEYLFNHGMNVALVAMRVAMRQGWSQRNVMNVGMASLFGDIGMLDVHPSIRMANRELTADEHQEIHEHPKYTVSRLASIPDIDPTVLMIAFQMHERSDSSGYPRRRRRSMIHPLSRIVCTADVYAAVVAPRPYRAAKTPYQGMVTVLHETRAGRLDRDVARDLLDAMSLFPIGSYVRLSDGTDARVLRANLNTHTKPIVVPLNRDGTESDVEVDLSRDTSLKITATLQSDEATGVTTTQPIFAAAG